MAFFIIHYIISFTLSHQCNPLLYEPIKIKMEPPVQMNFDPVTILRCCNRLDQIDKYSCFEIMDYVLRQLQLYFVWINRVLNICFHSMLPQVYKYKSVEHNNYRQVEQV